MELVVLLFICVTVLYPGTFRHASDQLSLGASRRSFSS